MVLTLPIGRVHGVSASVAASTASRMVIISQGLCCGVNDVRKRCLAGQIHRDIISGHGDGEILIDGGSRSRPSVPSYGVRIGVVVFDIHNVPEAPHCG